MKNGIAMSEKEFMPAMLLNGTTIIGNLPSTNSDIIDEMPIAHAIGIPKILSPTNKTIARIANSTGDTLLTLKS